MNAEEYRAHVRSDDFDVSCPHNGAVFYSNHRFDGGHLNRNSADDLGLTRLEQTDGGRWLQAQKTYESLETLDGQPTLWTRPDADSVWSEASTKFARSVSGNVTTRVIGAEPDTLFRSKELPALLENQKVTSINGVSREELKALYDRDKEAAFNRVCLGELERSREQVSASNDTNARDDLERREHVYKEQLAYQAETRAKLREGGEKPMASEKTHGQGRLDAMRAARNRDTSKAKDAEPEK